jgi:hypothetical protein
MGVHRQLEKHSGPNVEKELEITVVLCNVDQTCVAVGVGNVDVELIGRGQEQADDPKEGERSNFDRLISRVARWYIFIPNIKNCYILRGLRNLVYFTAIRNLHSVVVWYMQRPFGIFCGRLVHLK